MIKLITVKKLLITLVVILTIPVLIPLTQPGFFPTQDYIYVARVYQMNKALFDGHFPVRWVPDFRYGEPLYNFYAPLPYYVGAVVRLSTVSYLVDVKILIALGFILSGLAMFFLARELFGELGGLLSAILYIYAPYHSVDVYVRGALSESWALIFFPLIFLFSLKLSEGVNLKRVAFLALSLAGLFYTHNVMTLLFTPFYLVWGGVLVYLKKDKGLFLAFAGATLLGVGLGASFLLPSFFEKGYVQTAHLTVGYFDFRGHFVAVPQWFSTFWGYGASLWGSKDDMSFQVGVFHIFMLSLVLLSLIGGVIKKLSIDKRNQVILIVLFAEFIFSLFMMHNKSAPIWEAFPVLSFVQFPWRFLGISIFFASLIGGFFIKVLPAKIKAVTTAFLVLAAVSINIGYFHPESYYLDSQDEHYMGEKVLSQDDKLPKDYLPVWVKKINTAKLKEPHFVQGEGKIENVSSKTAKMTFLTTSEKGGIVEAPLTYFPGWKGLANNQTAKIFDPDELGLIRVEIPPGSQKIELAFKDTPIRVFSNLATLLSLAALFVLFKKT